MAGSFEVLLSALLSHDSSIRKQAEEQYNTLNIQTKLTHLVSTVRGSDKSADVKTLAAVLLRRLFLQSSEELSQIEVSVMEACRQELLLAIQTEATPSIRRKICDAVAELARASIDDDDVNHWPAVLKFLFTCCDIEQPHLYESSLQIIRIVPAVFANQLEQYFNFVHQMLAKALTCHYTNVSDEAFKAMCAVFVSLEQSNLRHRMVDLLPAMLNVLERSIQAQDDDSVLKAFIDLAEHRPKLLRSQMEKILDLMLKVMQLEEADESWRQLSLEMVSTLAENAPAMVRKHAKFIPQIVATSLKFMLQVEDDPEWSTTDDVGEEEDSMSISITGETALDRLANSLGGKAVLPHIIRTIPQMLISADWHYRHAALMAISAIGEGCEKQMVSVLEEVVNSVLPFCQDPHHRVKYAACNALGQMSSDFAPRLQQQMHAKVLPALLSVLQDSSNLRVMAHAGAALVNFCESCPSDILMQYMDTIVPKLEYMLQLGLQELVNNGRRLVLEQVVTTLGTVADTVDEKFVNYYDVFMNSLKYVMGNAVGKDLRLLRGKTIECISLIGLAVGKEKFMDDAQDIMSMLFQVQNEQESWQPDDPQASYMISAWARICKIIGPTSFVQYLPLIINPLISAASIKPEIAIVDSLEAEQNFSESDGWEFITLADQQRFGIKTAGMDDKCTAMQMLVVYAKDLQEGFAEYAEVVAKMMIPHLRFYFNELVRASAAEILPHLLECVKGKGPEAVQNMWSYISEKLLECVPLEPDPEITGIMIESLCKCIELLGANCFTPDQYAKIVEIIKDKLNGCFVREKERQEQRLDEDYDEQVEEELEEEDENDDNIMRKTTDLVHTLFQTHTSTILPLFEQLLPTIHPMLGEGRSASQRAAALCMFDDLLEFASQSAVVYQGYFLQPMVTSLCDHSPQVRQAASFGVGLMAQHCSRDFSRVCLDSLSLLVTAIQLPDAREDLDNLNATENAIAAVTRICNFLDKGVPYDTILPLWLSWLPVVEDKTEAPVVYSYLCDLIERNNTHILGKDNSNVPRILVIIAEAVAMGALEEDASVLQRLLAIVRHVQATDQVWEVCVHGLSDKQRTALFAALRA